MIEIQNVNFSYQNKENIIKDFSLSIPKESIYGFLGQNGAGKTTLIRLILSLLSPTSGEIRINNETLTRNKSHILRKIGTLIEHPALYDHLTGQENLELMCIYYQIGKGKIQEILKKVNLENVGNKKVQKYSLGMKQRLGIASSLIHDPELIILDEPMNGLDPQGIAEIRQIFIHLNQNEGKTIFYSSHILSEIENTCTDIAIIDAGRNIFNGTIADLRTKMEKEIVFQIECSEPTKAKTLLAPKFKLTDCFQENAFLINLTEKSQISSIISELVAQNFAIFEVRRIENSLENLFLQLIKPH